MKIRLKSFSMLSFSFPILVIFVVCFGTFHAHAIETNQIVAIVNKDVVTKGEVQRILESFMESIREHSRNEEELQANIEQAFRDIIDKKINDSLIAQDFEKQKGKMPEAYVESEVEELIKTRFSGRREAFVKYLSGLGKSLRVFKEELKKQLIVDYVSSKRLQEQLRISPSTVKEYYYKHQDAFRSEAKVLLRQIVLEPSEQQAKIVEMIQSVIQKKDMQGFIDLAKRYNGDAEMKKSEGACGWMTRKDLRAEFADILFKLPKGGFSPSFTLDGYVLFFYVENKQESSVEPLSKVYSKIAKDFQDEQASNFEFQWVKSLREKAFVKYF